MQRSNKHVRSKNGRTAKDERTAKRKVEEL